MALLPESAGYATSKQIPFHATEKFCFDLKPLTKCSLGGRRVFRCPVERLHMGSATVHKL